MKKIILTYTLGIISGALLLSLAQRNDSVSASEVTEKFSLPEVLPQSHGYNSNSKDIKYRATQFGSFLVLANDLKNPSRLFVFDISKPGREWVKFSARRNWEEHGLRTISVNDSTGRHWSFRDSDCDGVIEKQFFMSEDGYGFQDTNVDGLPDFKTKFPDHKKGESSYNMHLITNHEMRPYKTDHSLRKKFLFIGEEWKEVNVDEGFHAYKMVDES
jgi:hypothetical protein